MKGGQVVFVIVAMDYGMSWDSMGNELDKKMPRDVRL
jgi:hypothetical protein